MTSGGFTLWKDRGYGLDVPRFAWRRSSATATPRHLLLVWSGSRAEKLGSCSTPRCCCSAPGGLGSPVCPVPLAAAGIGTLGIVDDDTVDLSNLQRQVIHNSERLGVAKVDSAEATIQALNSDVNVEKYPVRLGPENIMEILPNYDIVVDGLNLPPTRYLLNDASVRLRIPVVSAAEILEERRARSAPSWPASAQAAR